MAERRALPPEILFLHVGWAREYRGAPDDEPVGKFGYIRRGGRDLGEAYNFKAFAGRCYGYAARWTINLRRLGASPGDESVRKVLVVWTATDPAQGGRYVIGWYRNATVHARMKERRPVSSRREAIVEAAAQNCHVIRPDERRFEIPAMVKGFPGIANSFFGDGLTAAHRAQLLAYVDGKPSFGFGETEADTSRASSKGGRPRSPDPEHRRAVEDAAVEATTAHFELMGWKVKDVSAQNLGWDLEATLSGRLLRIEVKGRSGEGSVELTPNEYAAMTDRAKRMSYRLAIVQEALTKPRLRIFAFSPSAGTDGAWLSGRDILVLKERTGAMASF